MVFCCFVCSSGVLFAGLVSSFYAVAFVCLAGGAASVVAAVVRLADGAAPVVAAVVRLADGAAPVAAAAVAHLADGAASAAAVLHPAGVAAVGGPGGHPPHRACADRRPVRPGIVHVHAGQ